MVARRLAATIPVLLIVSFGVFFLVSLVPGDPAVTLAGGLQATPQSIAHVRAQLHLNDPLISQYGHWLGSAVHLDFGTSLADGTSVSHAISSRFPVTLGLIVGATVVAVLVGTPLGLVSGIRPGGAADRTSRLGATLGVAVPNFWIAVMLVAVLAVHWRVLPPSGYTNLRDSPVGWFRHMILPSIALGLAAGSSLARQLRASMIDVLDQHYVRTAWAKGLSGRAVVFKHALKNAATPAITVLGLQVGYLLGGAVIIEQIFGIPGLGAYFVRGVLATDLPVIQGVTIVFVLVQLSMSLLVDISYLALNPKVRVG